MLYPKNETWVAANGPQLTAPTTRATSQVGISHISGLINTHHLLNLH
jgi:hypothetical protein